MAQLFKICWLMLIALAAYIPVNSQSINISDGAYIRMSGNSHIVILGNTPNTISKTGNIGGIITESEDAKVVWHIDNGTGTYMVPFCSEDGTTIRFTYDISTPGTGGGKISFTSYETPNDNLPMPTGVTHITDDYGTDNSLAMIDRYWIIEPENYTNLPQGTYTFTYDDDDLPGNFITEANLTSQRFNDDDNRWLDWLYGPTANPATNQLSIVIANPLDQYPIWTLVDINDPLPIELIRFITNCEDMTVTWVTATETNSDYVMVEGSDDGFEWKDIDMAQSTGNSNQLLTYTVNVSAYNYYRLRQVDLDGSIEYSDVIYGCLYDNEPNITLYPTVNDGRFYVGHTGTYNFEIFDMMGNLVYSRFTADTDFNVSHLAAGQYLLRMGNNINFNTFKFIIRK